MNSTFHRGERTYLSKPCRKTSSTLQRPQRSDYLFDAPEIIHTWRGIAGWELHGVEEAMGSYSILRIANIVAPRLTGWGDQVV